MVKIIKAYACSSKNKKILKDSSSGGVFYSIASYIIGLGGIVYGVVIDNGNVCHSRATTLSGVFPMLGSKYVKSDLNNTFSLCKKDLLDGKNVLYSGTPCQINLLHNYLKIHNIDTEKLVSVDIICHGVPKKEYWDNYLQLNFSEKKINTIKFRLKKEGWEKYYIKVDEYEKPFYKDPYIINFLSNKILDKPCFKCISKAENRCADITLGDFWGIEQVCKRYKNKNGTSLIVIRRKHNFLLDIIKRNCVINEVPFLLSVYNHNWPYICSVEKPYDYGVKPENLIINSSDIQDKNHFLVNLILNVKYFLRKFKTRAFNVFIDSAKNANNRIGIVTNHGYFNFGNRLQNYALRYLLIEFGKRPYNIYYESNDFTLLYKVFYFIKYHHRVNNVTTVYGIKRTCKKYEKHNYSFSRTKRKQKRICKFDKILYGSDQIWNLNFYKSDEAEFALGNFGIIKPSFKLISYAASICMPSLTERQSFALKMSLNNYSNISIREEESLKIVKSLGIEATKNLDPVFLLSKEEWKKAVMKYSKIKINSSDYLFKYFINDNNDCHYNETQELDCYQMMGNYKKFNHFDFINLIMNSSIIATDSFHCLAFSIIFKKKVIIFDRGLCGMETRITDILSYFNIPLLYGVIIDFGLKDYTSLLKEIVLSKNYLHSIL